MYMICRLCNLEKSIENFSIRKESNKPRHECKKCICEKAKQRTIKKRDRIISNGGHDYNIIMQKQKYCSKCDSYKLGKFFYKLLESEDGLFFYCKSCSENYSHDRIYKNDAYIATTEELNTIKKICKTCNQENLLKNFTKSKGKYGRGIHCKTCSNKKTKINRDKKEGKLNVYMSAAKKRGIDWELTSDEFLSFWEKNCNYCNSKIETIGLDRIDSNLSYSLTNVVPCCIICNKMKLDMPLKSWFEHMQKIIANLLEKM